MGSMKTKSTLLLLTATLTFGCAEAKPVARTVNDVARLACETSFTSQKLPDGLTVEDLCKQYQNLQPFITSILSASKTVGAANGMTVEPPLDKRE